MDIIYGEPLGPRVNSVVPLEDYKLLLTFDNGERRIFDAKRLLDMKAFAPLKNKPFFNLVRIEHDTISWPEDIDYCPDTLYMQSAPVADTVFV